ncbi:DUF1934 domain-containing protein [Ruminococcus albus]|uniref:DUF1934 domain-containing protein n=1 Tax=Ruminococcus albus (strain ATCC 27210 / DSM 20455 / JCM 14654 / NCDO 2250 / 7) TaxID=697329 RepID=E6UE28_RUMA7|nr:DUF1934 domain-containing protein [Ruminococcus albus]ADU22893.1 Domain of unknown function DUF1934 [Ruminococcus albus 7 = DSM 20455]
MDIKDVDIKLVSRQYEDFDDDPANYEQTEVLSVGTYKKTADGYVIEYEESEATGFEGCTTRIESFGKKKVVMSRRGSVSSELVIEPGEKHHCVYGTLYGNFEVGVEARKVSDKLTDDGGRLTFTYVVDVNSGLIGTFDIDIQLKIR